MTQPQPAEIIVVESPEQATTLYGETAVQVRERLAPFRGNRFATPATYKTGVEHIRVCRDLRLSFDETRKRLGDLARRHLQFVNGTGNELIDVCREVEDELKATKKEVDEKKARQKAEREEAERVAREAEVARKLAEAQARREAEAAAALATKVSFALDTFSVDDWIAAMDDGHSEYTLGDGQTTLTMGAAERAHPLVVARETQCREIISERRAAEQARLAEERARLEAEQRALAAEKARQEAELAAERAALAARRAEEERAARAVREALEAELRAAEAAAQAERDKIAAQQRAEQERLDAERQALEEQRKLAELAEAERRAAERARIEAAEQAEHDRIAAEEAAVREAERQAELARRLEALRPEREKALAFLRNLLEVESPQISDPELLGILRPLVQHILAAELEIQAIGVAP
jgi:DNA repair exonuclease SbcCD ATPase subunit